MEEICVFLCVQGNRKEAKFMLKEAQNEALSPPNQGETEESYVTNNKSFTELNSRAAARAIFQRLVQLTVEATVKYGATCEVRVATRLGKKRLATV
jgi:Tfp pilus assembly protein PilF